MEKQSCRRSRVFRWQVGDVNAMLVLCVGVGGMIRERWRVFLVGEALEGTEGTLLVSEEGAVVECCLRAPVS